MGSKPQRAVTNHLSALQVGGELLSFDSIQQRDKTVRYLHGRNLFGFNTVLI